MRFTLPLLVLGVVSAQLLRVEEPSTAHWWVANSLNTLRWTGQSNAPTTFSVFLANGNTALLTSKLALISVQPLYEYAKTVNPGGITPGQGYTIELTDTLNSSNIYATSQTFEIKAEGSAYPPQTTIDPSATVSGSSNPTAPSGSGAAASPSPTGGAEDLGVTAWPAVLAGTVAIGFAALW